MRQSQLFTKTLKDEPKDEPSVNARLLTKAGFIQKLGAGIYSYLPLGFLVLKKIENIIRDEMNTIGGEELLMPALHPKEIWEETGRWRTADYLYKLKDRQKKEYALGATHEEVITDIARKYISSYKDLPLYVYQIQTKFRDELRPKSGILRTKEFSMKDLYSFHADEKDFRYYYEKVKSAYLKIFKRCGFDDIIVAEAGGGIFTEERTHEFQIPTKAGEDIIIFCPKCGYAKNKEIAERCAGQKCPLCSAVLKEAKTIEVGNIFPLGARFSAPMSLSFTDKNGKKQGIIMGCYGIGPSRMMGAVVEVHHDKNGIIWPIAVAPFQAHLLKIKNQKSKVKINEFADKIYNDLQKRGIGVLYDEREDKTAGEKFADADLIGIPYRLVVSEKTLQKDCVEIKKRDDKKIKLIKIKDLRFEI
jgi:prolyl-tRNA synthetase